jgi:hypothetical protein
MPNSKRSVAFKNNAANRSEKANRLLAQGLLEEAKQPIDVPILQQRKQENIKDGNKW